MPQNLINNLTKFLTLVNELRLVPKFQAPENFFGFLNWSLAKNKYPFNGSNTCCHGLLKFGFLKIIVFFFRIDLIQSGISLLFDQSPPPITFPALPVEIPTFLYLKKLSL